MNRRLSSSSNKWLLMPFLIFMIVIITAISIPETAFADPAEAIEWETVLFSDGNQTERNHPKQLYIDRNHQLFTFEFYDDSMGFYRLNRDEVAFSQMKWEERDHAIHLPTSDGGYLVNGRSRENNEILVVKMDADGQPLYSIGLTTQFDLPLPSGAVTTFISSYAEVNDGYLLMGPETSHARWLNGDVNILICKVDLHGNTQWRKIINTDGATWIRSAHPLKYGNILLQGGFGSGASAQEFLMIIDQDGNLISETMIQGQAVYDAINAVNVVSETADGSILFLMKVSDGDWTADYRLVKMDRQLNQQWSREYPQKITDELYYRYSGVTALTNGEILLYGTQMKYVGSRQEYAALIHRLDQQGGIQSVSLLHPVSDPTMRAWIYHIVEEDGKLWFLGDANAESVYPFPWFGRLLKQESGGPSQSTPPASTVSQPSSWAVAEIEAAKGYGLTTIKVLSNYQEPITREELCELAVKLYEALSNQKAQTALSNTFVDTSNPEILKAYQLGIVNGIGDGLFAPNSPVTREQIAVMFHRTMTKAKSDIPAPSSASPTFVDGSQIASWARDAVNDMSARGIIAGTGDGRFNPQGNATREQGIALVKRVYEALQ